MTRTPELRKRTNHCVPDVDKQQQQWRKRRRRATIFPRVGISFDSGLVECQRKRENGNGRNYCLKTGQAILLPTPTTAPISPWFQIKMSQGMEECDQSAE